MLGIVKIQLQRFAEILSKQKITIKIDDQAKQWLATEGYNPTYGARPLKRLLQKELVNPLSTMVLESKIKDKVTVTSNGQGLQINTI